MPCIYIDVELQIFRQLMPTLNTPPPNTNDDKILATENMKKRIESFKQIVLS